MLPTISKSIFGKTPDGQTIDLFTLKNKSGGIVQITNYGGIIVSAKVPDREGNLGEVMLGFDDLDSYLTKNDPHFGGIIGRFGNRIANGRFSIDNNDFILAQNSGRHHLHGGKKGFDQQIWTPEIIEQNGGKCLKLSYLSPDGEEGYPGNLQCSVTYSFFENNELVIDYQAVTDKETIVNLTSHPYFNLKNGGKSSVYDHELKINADYLTAVDADCIPTGELMPVAHSPFDFKNFKTIGKDIDKKHIQLTNGNGYDHNFVIQATEKNLRTAAEVSEPETGRILTVLTTEPGVQFYSANWLNLSGKDGVFYKKHSAFCLETQHFPDSPNHPNFPSTILAVGDRYESKTVYRFGID